MSKEEGTFKQDKAVEKIHREEGLDEKDNSYNMSETLNDSNQRDVEEDNSSSA